MSRFQRQWVGVVGVLAPSVVACNLVKDTDNGFARIIGHRRRHLGTGYVLIFRDQKAPVSVASAIFHSSGGLSGSSEGFRHFCDCLNTPFRVFILGAKYVKRMGGNTVILSVADTKTPSKTPQGPQKAAKSTHVHLGTSLGVDRGGFLVF